MSKEGTGPTEKAEGRAELGSRDAGRGAGRRVVGRDMLEKERGGARREG